LVNFRGVSKTGNLRIAIVRRRFPERNARALWFPSLSRFWLKWCLEVIDVSLSKVLS
jgi:hypothetical protein